MNKVDEDSITEPIGPRGENLSDISDSAFDDIDEGQRDHEKAAVSKFQDSANDSRKRKLTRRLTNV